MPRVNAMHKRKVGDLHFMKPTNFFRNQIIVIQTDSPCCCASSIRFISRVSQMREFTNMPFSLFSPTRMQP